ncbi:carcinoembryonic antigen-related cell adhesion molecule 1-like, partial [Gigantopelta aegis]|uniref:carcinoembryonic antigen-related cell adhesion molecule 1-like n=1 Tax=Gigantopelta aegis TaxID=1735272 RepID=UPI001B88B475
MAVFMYTLVSMTAVNHVLGASLSISGSSSYAVLNKPFTLTCTVSQAADLSDKVQFLKKTASDVLVSLRQNGGWCSLFSRPPQGYIVSCDSGTDSSLSTTKTYTLRINRAAVSDAVDWWCNLDTARTRSNTFRLQLSSGPVSVTFSPLPPGSVAEGDSLSVTCAASCIPPCSYSWTPRHQPISPTSQLKLTNINRSHTGNVYTCTATNSFLSTSKTKQITLTVYYGPDSVQINTTSLLTVKEGDDVAVSCGATDCSPSCFSTWKFNSQNRSSITSLTLNSKSTPVTVDELTPMILRCDVTSNPGSDIKLLNNSQTLREVANSKQAEYTWNEAGCLDTGHYTCEAGNDIKLAVSETVQLVVR